MTISARSFGRSRARGAGFVWAALRQAAAWPGRVHRARQLMHGLAGLDEHELRDIGLTRQDLHDAGAIALDADPSPMLRRRVEERRRWR